MTPAKALLQLRSQFSSDNPNGFWASPTAQRLAAIQKAIPQPVSDFSQGFANTTTMGLLRRDQPANAAYRVGQVAGVVNPYNPVNKVFGALGQAATQPAVSGVKATNYASKAGQFLRENNRFAGSVKRAVSKIPFATQGKWVVGADGSQVRVDLPSLPNFPNETAQALVNLRLKGLLKR